MLKRIIILNNWITARYIKPDDIEPFLYSLRYLAKNGLTINPAVLVSPPEKSRRTSDVFLLSGVQISDFEKSNIHASNKLFLSYHFGNNLDKAVMVIDGKRILSLLNKFSSDTQLAKSLFKDISDFIVDTRDGDAELRYIDSQNKT